MLEPRLPIDPHGLLTAEETIQLHALYGVTQAALQRVAESVELLGLGLRLAAGCANVPSLRELVRCSALLLPLSEPPTEPETIWPLLSGPLVQVAMNLLDKAQGEPDLLVALGTQVVVCEYVSGP